MSPERDVRSRTAGVGTQKFISPFLISLISARKSWQPPGAVRYGVSNRAKRFQPSTRAKPPSSLSCESPLAPPCSHTSFNPPSHVSSSLSLSLSLSSRLLPLTLPLPANSLLLLLCTPASSIRFLDTSPPHRPTWLEVSISPPFSTPGNAVLPLHYLVHHSAKVRAGGRGKVQSRWKINHR